MCCALSSDRSKRMDLTPRAVAIQRWDGDCAMSWSPLDSSRERRVSEYRRNYWTVAATEDVTFQVSFLRFLRLFAAILSSPLEPHFRQPLHPWPECKQAPGLRLL
jgi:hypothetical protein